jgi:hypothetical protein
MPILVTLGAKELLGSRARLEDAVESAKSLNRTDAVQVCVRVLNLLQVDALWRSATASCGLAACPSERAIPGDGGA